MPFPPFRRKNVPPQADPVSLQDQIHAVQAMRSAAPPRRRTGAKVVVGGAVLAAIVALWQFGPRFGWGTGGKGSGSAPGGQGVVDGARLSSSRQAPDSPPTRPLRVTIDGTHYFVDGKEVDLATVTKLASR